MLVSINDPIIGALTVAGNPIKLSGVLDPATRRARPRWTLTAPRSWR